MQTRTLVEGRDSCEGPRWHAGRFWFTDFFADQICSVDCRAHDGTIAVHADLSGVATFHCNDMLVDPDGRADVGNSLPRWCASRKLASSPTG